MILVYQSVPNVTLLNDDLRGVRVVMQKLSFELKRALSSTFVRRQKNDLGNNSWEHIQNTSMELCRASILAH
jgi:hypothetical protein